MRALLFLFLCASAVLFVPTALAQDDAAMSTLRLLTDFTEADVAQRWATVNDNVMGGRSVGGPTFTDETVVFAGATNTNGGGFSSIRTRPGDYDLGAYEGIELRFRADGRTYEFEMYTGERAGGIPVVYRASFRATTEGMWETVRLPFTAFRASRFGRPLPSYRLDPARGRYVGLFVYDGQDGPFRLEVDQISAYQTENTASY
ncbi:MAG: CIA30 family protein [Bacteroidota bacterium]